MAVTVVPVARSRYVIDQGSIRRGRGRGRVAGCSLRWREPACVARRTYARAEQLARRSVTATFDDAEHGEHSASKPPRAPRSCLWTRRSPAHAASARPNEAAPRHGAGHRVAISSWTGPRKEAGESLLASWVSVALARAKQARAAEDDTRSERRPPGVARGTSCSVGGGGARPARSRATKVVTTNCAHLRSATGQTAGQVSCTCDSSIGKDSPMSIFMNARNIFGTIIALRRLAFACAAPSASEEESPVEDQKALVEPALDPIADGRAVRRFGPTCSVTCSGGTCSATARPRRKRLLRLQRGRKGHFRMTRFVPPREDKEGGCHVAACEMTGGARTAPPVVQQVKNGKELNEDRARAHRPGRATTCAAAATGGSAHLRRACFRDATRTEEGPPASSALLAAFADSTRRSPSSSKLSSIQRCVVCVVESYFSQGFAGPERGVLGRGTSRRPRSRSRPRRAPFSRAWCSLALRRRGCRGRTDPADLATARLRSRLGSGGCAARPGTSAPCSTVRADRGNCRRSGAGITRLAPRATPRPRVRRP